MSTSAPVVETQDLSVTYGPLTAVDQVTIQVGPGEIFGLLGPNGAGKTSVIRALTTIVPVASGTAAIGGHPLSDPVAVRSKIGVLPESNGYPTAQTASSYLRFYGRLFGLSQAEAGKRAERLLHQFGLGDNRNRIGTFSRGMRQRLGLARALINDPAVLFLDEPTLGLDPAGKEEIMRYLTRTAFEKDTCVILCSHLLDEVERVCDRIAIMHRSRIIAQGSVDQVIADSGVTGWGKIRVNACDVERAELALRVTDARSIRFDNTRPGDIEIRIGPAEEDRSQLLQILLAADVVPRSFDLEGARLSEAFLALTQPDITTEAAL